MLTNAEFHLNNSSISITGLSHVAFLETNRSCLLYIKTYANMCSTISSLSQCAALVGEDQPLCPDLPELDLSELDVSDLDADTFLGGLVFLI